MLREIHGGRRTVLGITRRWFQSEWFDLFLWLRSEELLRFQLSYDRQGDEHLLAWDRQRGYSHHGVDAGEENPRSNMSPLLVPDGIFPFAQVIPRFEAESAAMEPALRARLLELLRVSSLPPPSPAQDATPVS